MFTEKQVFILIRIGIEWGQAEITNSEKNSWKHRCLGNATYNFRDECLEKTPWNSLVFNTAYNTADCDTFLVVLERHEVSPFPNILDVSLYQ